MTEAIIGKGDGTKEYHKKPDEQWELVYSWEWGTFWACGTKRKICTPEHGIMEYDLQNYQIKPTPKEARAGR